MAANSHERAVALRADLSDGRLRYGVEALSAALRQVGWQPRVGPDERPAPVTIAVSSGDGGPVEPQAFAIQAAGPGIWRIVGADPAGAMYGALEAAEDIRLGGGPDGLQAKQRTPAIARRGIKFNIPLDVRTPSYSDTGDSAQHNLPEMWSLEFWQAFLDQMARHRFNVLTLWNLHPFPSLVRVPEYPEVALDDVWRTRVPFDTSYKLTGVDMLRPAQLADVEVVKRLTIDEKIAFWNEVLERAHDRAIDVYWFTWNIFCWGAEGKHGITDDQANPTTIDYFRCSVRELLLTYPRLAGIGITAGEHMPDGEGAVPKEQWLWQAYGRGIMEAKAQQPGRVVRVIHRYHMSNYGRIADAWRDYPDPFDLSYKYAVAHVYTSPAPPFANRALAELPPERKLWMTVRNDDLYSFRFGDPQFIREFIQHLPGPERLAGFYLGPDGYTWGREFISTTPAEPRQLVIERDWYSFLLWGRLAYEPDLPDARLQAILAAHFPSADTAVLDRAWRHASRVVPLINRAYWNDIDLKWFPEACLSHPTFKGFHTVAHLIAGDTYPGSGWLNIRDYTAARLAGQAPAAMTPPQVAEALEHEAAAAETALAQLAAGDDTELRLTLGDIKALALLGRYYAAKLRGATALAWFDATGDEAARQEAIGHLTAGVTIWQSYADVAGAQYRPQFLTRVGLADLQALRAKVEDDVQIAQTWTPSKSAPRRP